MNYLKKGLCCLIIMICMSSISVIAQKVQFSKYFNAKDSTQVHVMEMRDGEIFKGHVVSIEIDSITFTTQRNVVIEVNYKEVESIKVVGKDHIPKRPKRNVAWEKKVLAEMSSGEKEKVDTFYPQSMFIHSTAFKPMPKGTRSYQNVDFYFNSWEYGLGNGLAAGIQTIFPAVTNFHMKYNYSFSKIIHVGGNLNMISIYGFGNFFGGADGGDLVVYPYGVVTIGEPKAYLNVTAGVFFPTGKNPEYIEKERAVFTVGFGGQENRFVYKGTLAIFKEEDYYYYAGNNREGVKLIWTLAPAFSLGWKGRKTQIDLGVIILVNEEFALPYLSLKRRIK